jgi:hypothetical protein
MIFGNIILCLIATITTGSLGRTQNEAGKITVMG